MDAQLLAEGLDLQGAAKAVVKEPMDHFPSLLTDRCLENHPSLLADATKSHFHRHRAAHEIVTMPRSTFGQRPVAVLSPESRTLYEALVKHLSTSLAEATRGPDAWKTHQSFGLSGTHDHVVEVDIASCYEYVNHRTLADELLLRSMDVAAVDALQEFLGWLTPRGYGIPQMLTASDRLADTYLSIMDRGLSRVGITAHRYADDLRLLARDWEHANQAIEVASGIARDLGLVLSTEKTRIFKRTTLISHEVNIQKALDGFSQPETSAVFLAPLAFPYEDEDVDSDEHPFAPGFEEFNFRILNGFLNEAPDDPSNRPEAVILRRLVRRALANLRGTAKRRPDEDLQQLVFRDAQRFEDVCRYLEFRGRRPEFAEEPHWTSVAKMAFLKRQSPWAKIWLLNTVKDYPAPEANEREAYAEFLTWSLTQAEKDAHETVRVEAAWFLACQGQLQEGVIRDLYAASSSLSRPALAASVARQQLVAGGLSSSVVNAVCGESPLTKAASEWATT